MQFNALTLALQNFIGVFSGGFGRLSSAMNTLLATLVGIDLVLTGLFWALGAGEGLAAVFRKVLTIGFWTWLVQSFPTIAKALVDSLVSAGLLAGGGGMTIGQLLDPSSLAGAGLDATEPLVKKLSDMGAFDLPDMIVFAVGYLVIMGCYVLMAIHLFLAVLEYYVFAAVVGILLPFGVLPSTRFLAEKAVGAVAAAAIKLMVLALVTSAVFPILTRSPLSGSDMNFNELWAMVLTIGGITVLSWRAPALAASLMAGAPNLSGSEMIRTGAGTAISGVTFAAGVRAYAPALSASVRSAAAAARLGRSTGSPGRAPSQGASRAAGSPSAEAAAPGPTTAGPTTAGAAPSLVQSLGTPPAGPDKSNS